MAEHVAAVFLAGKHHRIAISRGMWPPKKLLGGGVQMTPLA
ncbi:hypothetical protein [Rhizobium cauense]|nr:hypothetical protein [Rhizobium cauense]